LILVAGTFSSSAVHFDCEFEIGEWFVLGVVYNCEPKVSSINEKYLIESVEGEHLPNKALKDVKTLNVRFQDLPKIPINLADFFPNLEGIQWYKSNLQALSADELKSFPNLQVFSSYENPLVVLDGDIFVGTPRLQWLSFYNNSIENVGYGLISSLYSLAYANFQENVCINRVMTHPAMMGELIQELKERCPSLTEPEECDHRCSLNEEVDKLFYYIDYQNERIYDLNVAVANYERRIAELERIVMSLSEKLD
jgi:hypothetical protein